METRKGTRKSGIGSDSDGEKSHEDSPMTSAFDRMPNEFKFRKPEALELYSKYLKFAEVNRGMPVMFSELPTFPAIDKLACMGLDSLLSIDVPCYPLVVKLFYANAIFSEDCDRDEISVKSFVLGRQVEFSVAKLNSVLKTPNAGEKFFSFGEWADDKKWDEAKRIFWNGEECDLRKGEGLNALISVELFFLHKVLNMTLLSASTQSGHHSTDMSYLSAYLLFKTHKCEPINVGYFMLKYMLRCFKQRKTNLPYGMILSHLLKVEGAIRCKDFMEPKKSRKVVDLKSLAKMHIHVSDSGVWYKDTRESIPSCAATHSDCVIASSAQAPVTSDDDLRAEIKSLKVAVAALDVKLGGIETKLDTILTMLQASTHATPFVAQGG